MAKTARRKLRQISRTGALSAEERARRILDERTRALAARSGSEPSATVDVARVLICTIGREHYGIPVDAVAEVLPFQECLPLPEGPPALVGLFGRSGQLVSVVDLGKALGVATAPEDGGRHLVLLRRSSPRIALRVDRAEGVETVTPMVHEENGGFRKEAVIGYAETSTGIADQERILSLLDLDRLLRPFLSPSSASGA